MKTVILGLLITFSTSTAAPAEWEIYDIGMPAQIAAAAVTMTQPANPSSTNPVVAVHQTQK